MSVPSFVDVRLIAYNKNPDNNTPSVPRRFQCTVLNGFFLCMRMLHHCPGRHLGTQRVLAVSSGASHTAVLVASQSVLTFGNNE